MDKKKEVMKKLLAKKGKGGPGSVDSDSVGQYAIDDPTKAVANMDTGMYHGKGGPGMPLPDPMAPSGMTGLPPMGGGASGSAMGASPMPNLGPSTSQALSPSRFPTLSAPAPHKKGSTKKGILKSKAKAKAGK